MATPVLSLKGFEYAALHSPEGLNQLDQAFVAFLQQQSPELAGILHQHRSASLKEGAYSQWIIGCAPYVEQFIADLFGIEAAVEDQHQPLSHHYPIFTFQKELVGRLAKRCRLEDLPSFEVMDQWLESHIKPFSNKEIAVSEWACHLLADKVTHEAAITQLSQWCASALYSPEGQHAVKNWISFKQPEKLDYEHLIPLRVEVQGDIQQWHLPEEQLRTRDGFHYTHHDPSDAEALYEINYCVYCHKNEGDYCSKGFLLKKKEPDMGFKVNPLGEMLTGCPLDEKISEMHFLKKSGYSIAALATIMIDNPLCPLTGERICNDCMKACIYQKQEPVNIPQTETYILKDVLRLPWGVEIYDLLMRWNPLRSEQYCLKPYQGLNVLVMGLGPAGVTLAHHLVMEGCAVVGMDGLKIEPLPNSLVENPIYEYESICEDLAERSVLGFGGVSEYGITVRWDKNFLKLVYLCLSRRAHFQAIGNVRFGGAITIEKAWELGFDHVAVAVGAGLPKELPIPGSLAPGMRQANDFLMALQLTGAARENSLTNLQIRLPAIVIGGGLTGVDAATEIQAYYILQVEKTLVRYEALCAATNEAHVRQQFTSSDLEVLDEHLTHGRAVRNERAMALRANRSPYFLPLLRAWGGVSIVYRRRLMDSPAYRKNHEEVHYAFEEGIYYIENLEPVAALTDHKGDIEFLECAQCEYDAEGLWFKTNRTVRLPARCVLVATGAKPNVAYAFEHPHTFERIKFEYIAYARDGEEWVRRDPPVHPKAKQFGAFTSYREENHCVSFVGDTNPTFQGSVVKAVASAKRIYPHIMQELVRVKTPEKKGLYATFRANLVKLYESRVVAIKRVTSRLVELTVESPMAALSFKPGQFYRLQNFEYRAQTIHHTRLQMESVALLAAPVIGEPHQLSFSVIEQGTSTRLLERFRPGEPIALMGPTGVRSKIPEPGTSVLVIGSDMAAIYLRAYGPSLKNNGNRVVFWGIYSTPQECVYHTQLAKWCDSVVVTPSLEENPPMLQHQLSSLHTIWVIGPAELARSFQELRAKKWNTKLPKDVEIKASVYGPMQCMLKGVCAQCLQWQIDPVTGRRTKAVYTCSWNHQPIDIIDWDNLNERLRQNAMQEQLTELWYRHCQESQ